MDAENVACLKRCGDANVNPEDFRKSLWVQRKVHDYRSAARRKSYLLV